MSIGLPTTTEPEINITNEQIDIIQKTIAVDATPTELQLFFYDCKRRGVHPLDRLIHFTKRKGKYTPITSIDFMRTRAHETGDCAGIDDAAFVMDENNKLISATVTVYRLVKGQRYAFTATARWTEYCPGEGQDFMWKKMPHTMLGKCAEALALRKAFPAQLAGLYESAEMDQANEATAKPLIKVPQKVEEEKPESQPQGPIKRPGLISDAQRNRLFAISRTAGKTEDKVRDYIHTRYGIEHTSDIKREWYEDICTWAGQKSREPGEDDE